MRLYRENFRPSELLDEPYILVSVGSIADNDPVEARRQSASSAMAMMRMFQRTPFALLPPDEVEAYPANGHERAILEEWTDRTLHGTAADVAQGLELLHRQTDVDEVMLVAGGPCTPGANPDR